MSKPTSDTESNTSNEPARGNLPLTGQQKQREIILATASGGMAIALSTILSLIILWPPMLQGGSITAASMLPLVFFALAFGPAWGIGAGAAHGILQYIINPQASNFASFILDYPVAFSLLGLAGFFAASRVSRSTTTNVLRRVGMVPLWKVMLGAVIACIGRFACHTLSGVIFYAMYAGDQNVWLYSVIYNGTYMLPETILTTILLVPLAAIFRQRRI